MRSFRFATIVTLVLACRAIAAAPATTRGVSARLSCLDLASARDAIVDDSTDPYFDKLCPAEMSAKTAAPITGDTLAEQIAECTQRYQAECREFTIAEKEALTAAVGQIHPLMAEHYPSFAKQPWSFLKVSNNLEGGMPHTRGPHIVIPARFAEVLALRARPKLDSRLVELLIHEQTHVIQRQSPKKFEGLYVDVLGFKRATKIESHPDIEAIRVINPDGPVCDWVYPLKVDSGMRWIWPRIVLKDASRAALQLDFLAVDVEPAGEGEFKVKLENGKPATEPLSRVRPYVEAMRAGFDSYHPNEVAAHLFAKLFVTECWSGGTSELTEFRGWAKREFAR